MTDIPPTSPTAVPPPPAMDEKEINDGKVRAALGVIPIVTLVVLIIRNNAFAVYHAKQWLMLCILAFVGWIPMMILAFVPGVNCLIIPAGMLFGVAIITLAVFGIINAVNGKVKALPVIGVYGEKWFAGIQKKPTP